MFSRGSSEGDQDEGSKQLIERDKVGVEHSVMNVSNKMCVCVCVATWKKSRKHMMLGGRGGFNYRGLLLVMHERLHP